MKERVSFLRRKRPSLWRSCLWSWKPYEASWGSLRSDLDWAVPSGVVQPRPSPEIFKRAWVWLWMPVAHLAQRCRLLCRIPCSWVKTQIVYSALQCFAPGIWKVLASESAESPLEQNSRRSSFFKNRLLFWSFLSMLTIGSCKWSQRDAHPRWCNGALHSTLSSLTAMPLKVVLFDCVQFRLSFSNIWGMFFCWGLKSLKHNLFAAVLKRLPHDAESLFCKVCQRDNNIRCNPATFSRTMTAMNHEWLQDLQV